MKRTLFWLILILTFSATAYAQDNYEIQVYGSETIPPGITMVELHSNFTIKGTKQTIDGVLPTNHAWHETLEITQGFLEFGHLARSNTTFY